MYQAFNSDDGKLKGVSKEEAEKYEEGLKNPLSRMNFPYSVLTSGVIQGRHGSVEWEKDERKALVAFANLAPLIAECDETYSGYKLGGSLTQTPLGRLLTAYDEAVALIPKP